MITAIVKVKSATISARITRADGRVEELGVISRVDNRSLWEKIINYLKLWIKQSN